MTIKRTITASIIIVFSILITAFAALSCLFLFVPQYVESEVIPSIIKDNGLKVSSLEVRSIGLKGAEISDVKIGPDNSEGFKIDTIRLDYSISGLLDKKLERVVLSGVSVNVKYENKNLSIEGLDNLIKDQQGDSDSSSGSTSPVTINSIMVTNSTLNLLINDKVYYIPFGFTAAAFNKDLVPGNISADIYPEGNKIKVEGKRTDNGRINLTATADKVSLSVIEGIINEIISVNVKGEADIDLSAVLSFEPFSLRDISFSCSLGKTNINYSGIILKNPSNPASDEQEININIDSPDASHWNYDISPILFVYDSLPVSLNLSGNADLANGALMGEINAATVLMTGNNTPVFRWNILAEKDISSNMIKVQIDGQTDIENKKTPFNTSYNGVDITTRSPKLNAFLEYSNGLFSGTYRFNLDKFDVNMDEMSFSMPSVSIEGSLVQAENNVREYVSSFSLKGKEITCKDMDIKASIPDYLIKGKIMYDMENGLKTDAKLTFKKGRVSMKDGLLNVKGINGELPGAWPVSEIRDKGRLHVETVNYENYSLGPIDLKIPIKGSEISFTGTAEYPALPDMTIELSGNTSLDSSLARAEVKVNVPEYQPSSKLDLGKFAPELKGFFFNGNVKGAGEVIVSNSILTSGLDFVVQDGRITNSEKKLSVENLSLNLILDNLITPKSPFGQKLKINKVSLGDVEATDFLFDFRIDSLSSLFIEQGQFKWCGGTINLQSFRIDTNKDEYQLTLFCDRIRLAEILEQFGVAGVSGGGTVNGKIPLIISKGKISFEDGFLYSTPGGGGKINITGTDIFTQGMTPGSPEYVQMDIASEALKDFDYSWVKMSLNSEKEELTVKLQFDGKPENKLPFRYDKDLNRFMRVETSVEGSNFQGIRLDVNFRLPLDELLNYKGALDMIN